MSKPTETVETPKPRRPIDPELSAMSRITRILSECNEDAQDRIVEWLRGRINQTQAAQPKEMP